MDKDTLLQHLKTKPDLHQLALEAGNDSSLLAALFEVVRSERSPLRYSCTKTIRFLSEQQPEKVYPYFLDTASWLQDTNSFVKWDGILTLANLAAVDTEHRFESFYEMYFGLLRDTQMVTAASVAGNAWKIVQARPDWESDITARLLEVPQIVYLHHGKPSPECNRVMCGHILDCFDQYFAQSHSQAAILRFAQSQLDSPRKSVAKAAARFLKRHKNTAANPAD